ncbi:MAG: hypothetical protein V3R85_05975 [Alphaproteobacteria bacterium]
MKTYEFLAFRNGKWEIQASYEDREEAVLDAGQAVSENRFLGIRVTEEVFDEDSNLTKTRSIFSYEFSAALDRSGREEQKLTGLKKLRRKLQGKDGPDLLSAEHFSDVASTRGFAMPILYLFVILFLGVFSLIGLRTLFGAS